MSTRKRRDPRSLEPEAPEMYAAPKRRRKTVRPPDDEPNVGRIIENGLAMLIPFIIERIVVNATARTEPVPPTPRVPGYFEGYQHAIDEARYVVRTGCPGCGCALCRKIMSDDEPVKGTPQ